MMKEGKKERERKVESIGRILIWEDEKDIYLGATALDRDIDVFDGAIAHKIHELVCRGRASEEVFSRTEYRQTMLLLKERMSLPAVKLTPHGGKAIIVLKDYHLIK